MSRMTGITPKCKKCGERRLVGNTNGVPNMIGFQMQNGKTINLCSKCIAKIGEMSDEDKNKFFEDIQK